MIAIVQIGGHQALIEKGEKIEVDKLDVEIGKTVDLETFLVSNPDGSDFQLGSPTLGKIVQARVLEHARGGKIRIFKMKPRKRYRRTQGHRQDYTIIEIVKIAGGGVSKKAEKAPAVKSEKESTASEKKAGKKPVGLKAEKPKTTKPKTTAKKATPKKKD
jgi:large subunit ribosomal protein L21